MQTLTTNSPFPDKFDLVQWPEEDSASVASCQGVWGGTRPGDTCTVSCVQVCVHVHVHTLVHILNTLVHNLYL